MPAMFVTSIAPAATATVFQYSPNTPASDLAPPHVTLGLSPKGIPLSLLRPPPPTPSLPRNALALNQRQESSKVLAVFQRYVPSDPPLLVVAIDRCQDPHRRPRRLAIMPPSHPPSSVPRLRCGLIRSFRSTPITLAFDQRQAPFHVLVISPRSCASTLERFVSNGRQILFDADSMNAISSYYVYQAFENGVDN
ncbi:uncharacterized protein PGTG_11145 [Puccinia graminis f. sp. tritici CRL 75-36-700-3]|uniref:Uncharacterized protein n=1 Tax=Puccinia graminis f. sp. tritici (strain CRL 75-36-700-3 / race SCCL) TaxID=418459 RepID=E3KL01_PUCGT|nr:uncharacterized protein PGTG_11145 [Puccinia graminis f. sp. tritici CRL 75-36-700-3]EFP84976.2 hypothetical protein PGTG_11145 [Puccinia graminis f. sp. tritici CRL 75-36-700-3]